MIASIEASLGSVNILVNNSGMARAQAPERIAEDDWNEVEEAADAVLMLARNGYITGRTININGGLYMS